MLQTGHRLVVQRARKCESQDVETRQSSTSQTSYISGYNDAERCMSRRERERERERLVGAYGKILYLSEYFLAVLRKRRFPFPELISSHADYYLFVVSITFHSTFTFRKRPTNSTAISCCYPRPCIKCLSRSSRADLVSQRQPLFPINLRITWPNPYIRHWYEVGDVARPLLHFCVVVCVVGCDDSAVIAYDSLR